MERVLWQEEEKEKKQQKLPEEHDKERVQFH